MISKRIRAVALGAVVATLVAGGVSPATSQTVHPEKAVYAHADAWPTLAVGEVRLANFQPFRAVYERVYRNMGGEPRHDRVIVTAERVAWNETRAISVSLIDAGNDAFDDTAMRTATRVFAEDDHRLLLLIAPAPSTARDYMIGHTDGRARATVVTAETGEATILSDVFPLPQLGAPGLWLAGSMPLEVDRRISFANADAPAPSSILGAPKMIATGRERIDAGPLGEVDAWVVTYPLGMTSGRVQRTFVIDRPPYLIGKRPLDLDTGETTEIGTLRLIEFTTFGRGR